MNEWQRDSSGALINNDVDAYKLHREKQRKTRQQQNKVIELENRVKDLEERLDAAIRKFENQG